MPLLEYVHALIKFTQMKDVYVCDLVVAIKVFQGDIYLMYCDQTSKFIIDNFWTFKSLLEFENENIQMRWAPNLNSSVQHLAFEANGQHIWVVHRDLETSFPSYMNEDVFVIVESLVKNHAKVMP
jgi:hypothetical protein